MDISVPSMTAEEWFNGSEAAPKLISMKPVGMTPRTIPSSLPQPNPRIPCPVQFLSKPLLPMLPIPLLLVPPWADIDRRMLTLVSQAPVEKKKTVIKGSSYQRILSEKEKEELAMKEMFDKAKRLDFDDEDIEGIPKRGNTDAGFDDDDWE